MLKLVLIILGSAFFFTHALSYVGPGMGGGLIAATLGIVIAIIASIFAILWFPIKRFINKRKQENLKQDKSNEEEK